MTRYREAFTRNVGDYRKCEGCGSTLPVKETDPPSGFLDWVPINAERDQAERETLRYVVEQVAYGLWGDMPDSAILVALRAMARAALPKEPTPGPVVPVEKQP